MAKILVVDDEPHVRQAIVSMLHEDKHETVEAFDGLGALEGVKEHHPDMLLCDWMLPELFGGEVINTLRNDAEYAEFQKLPIIVVSDFADETSEQKFTQAGADAFVAKNDNLEEMKQDLLSTIETLLHPKPGEPRIEQL